MQRRHFLKSLTGLFVAAAVDPEELLWTPKRTFFISPSVQLYWNRFVTMEMVTNEALRLLRNKMQFTQFIDPAYMGGPLVVDEIFSANVDWTDIDNPVLLHRRSAKIGSTITIRKPARYAKT